MQDLIQQYRESLRKVRKAKETANEADRSILSGMESDLEFAIKWMETGRMPGSRRGAERRAAYERELPADPHRMEMTGKYFRPAGAAYIIEPVSNYGIEEPEIEEDDRETILLFIDDILSCLSEREREVFEMRHVGGLTQDEIADALGVSQPRVVALLESANRKLERWRNCERWGL